MEKKEYGGFSGPIKIAYTFFWDCCWEDQMEKMRGPSKEKNRMHICGGNSNMRKKQACIQKKEFFEVEN